MRHMDMPIYYYVCGVQCWNTIKDTC